jgi:hypothetical protein
MELLRAAFALVAFKHGLPPLGVSRRLLVVLVVAYMAWVAGLFVLLEHPSAAPPSTMIRISTPEAVAIVKHAIAKPNLSAEALAKVVHEATAFPKGQKSVPAVAKGGFGERPSRHPNKGESKAGPPMPASAVVPWPASSDATIPQFEESRVKIVSNVLAQCHDATAQQIWVITLIADSGEVVWVRPEGTLSTEAKSCVDGIVRSMKFPTSNSGFTYYRFGIELGPSAKEQ